MPKLTNDEIEQLSLLFRRAVGDLSTNDRKRFEETIQSTFAIKNVRNVQLWTREGSQQRNFINRNSSPLELEMRLALLRGLVAPANPSRPQKERTFFDSPKQAGQKLRRYLQEDYTRDNLNAIRLENGLVTYVYDAYGDGSDKVDDEESDEFDDLFDL